MGRPTFFYFFLVLFLLTASLAEARWDSIPGTRFDDVRGAAMGDSGLAVVDEASTALFANPAHIATLDGPHFQPLNTSLFANQTFFDIADLNFFKAFGPQGFASTLNSNPGRNSGVGFHFYPNYSMRYLSFGLLTQSQMYAQSDGLGNIITRAKYQVIPAAGVAIPLARGRKRRKEGP